MIEVADDRQEASVWLGWVGWAKYLRGLDAARLYGTMEAIEEDKEPICNAMMTA